jgi:riboflavin biosynthesis pyrimidine reductase
LKVINNWFQENRGVTYAEVDAIIAMKNPAEINPPTTNQTITPGEGTQRQPLHTILDRSIRLFLSIIRS